MNDFASDCRDDFPDGGSELKEAVLESLLDTSEEETFDRLTKLATVVLDVPIALVSLIDTNRQFFKSQQGLPEDVAVARETPLTHSFCKHVRATSQALIVDDARNHPLVRDNLAISDLGVIAYAGVPIFDPGGRPIGSFCAIDTKPKAWSEHAITVLYALASQATSEIALRVALDQRGLDLANLRKIEERRSLLNRADRHDLRTPLNAVVLSIQSVRYFGPVTEDQEESLEVAERNARVLQTMIDQLLDVGNVSDLGKDSLKLVDCQPAEIVALAAEQVQSIASSSNHSILSKVGVLPLILADRDKLVRVVVNLLANALKFTPDGGRVEIDAITDEEASAVVFTIVDNGIGISAENVGKIFEDGFRVESGAPIQRSAGVGLAFCEAIVRAHHGEIRVESELGRGSKFSFSVPISSSKVVAESPPKEDNAHLRLLLIEDHEDTGVAVTRGLQSYGHQVTRARSVAEAVGKVVTEEFDVIVSDIGLPDGNGVSLINGIRRFCPTPAIAVTAFGHSSDAERCLAAGFDAHYGKPIDLPTLNAAVLEAFAAGPRPNETFGINP